ncbi:MAG: hypothetical protein KKG75_04420 [Nanoarchaeota archaeon]|nr:hypothetical protein [Nanoarchaeota archaeon]
MIINKIKEELRRAPVAYGFATMCSLLGVGMLTENELPASLTEVDPRVKKHIEEIMVESREPRISVYDDRTEVDFRYGDRWYGGSVLIDEGNDGTVDEKVGYPPPFRGVGTDYNAKVTETDQRR